MNRDQDRDGAATKRMVALTSLSEAAGLAVACSDDDPLAAPVKRAMPPQQLSERRDTTWAEPQFRDGFEPRAVSSPRSVVATTLAQWLTSRSLFRTS